MGISGARRRFPLRSSLKEREVLLPGGRFHLPLQAVRHLYDTGRINEAASLAKEAISNPDVAVFHAPVSQYSRVDNLGPYKTISAGFFGWENRL